MVLINRVCGESYGAPIVSIADLLRRFMGFEPQMNFGIYSQMRSRSDGSAPGTSASFYP